jgi:hypothetical protein
MNLMSENNDRTIEKIIDLMQRDESIDAPADSIQWAKNLFRARIKEPKKSLSQKVLAVLQMDLSPNKAVFGERSASSAVRQMLFEAGENSIDLRISKTKKGLNLHGQILGAGFANCTIRIVGEASSPETHANELSEFNFVEIPSGKYDLTLQSNENEIVIEDLLLD